MSPPRGGRLEAFEDFLREVRKVVPEPKRRFGLLAAATAYANAAQEEVRQAALEALNTLAQIAKGGEQ